MKILVDKVRARSYTIQVCENERVSSDALSPGAGYVT